MIKSVFDSLAAMMEHENLVDLHFFDAVRLIMETLTWGTTRS